MTTPRSRSSRGLDVVLTLGALLVFVCLWIGLAWALVADPTLPERAWEWLRGLPVVPQVVAWLAFLPIAVGLWAWNAALPPIGIAVVLAGLVAWTGLMLRSVVRLARTSTPA